MGVVDIEFLTLDSKNNLNVNIYTGHKLSVNIILDNERVKGIYSNTDEYVFILFSSSNNRIMINEIYHQLSSKVICLKPGTTCEFKSLVEIKWIYYFKADVIYEFGVDYDFMSNYVDLNELNPKIVMYTKEFIRECHRNKLKKDIVCGYIEDIIINKLLKDLIKDDYRSCEKALSSEINSVIEFMYHNIHNKITLEDMALNLKMSVPQFCRKFKEETGQSPTSYLNDLRIDRAKRMLEKGNESITEIALLTGLGNSSYFASRFKKITGFSPLEYRQEHNNRSIKV